MEIVRNTKSLKTFDLRLLTLTTAKRHATVWRFAVLDVLGKIYKLYQLMRKYPTLVL